MKVTRSVRLTEETMKAVSWLQRRHGDETSDAIRRLVRRGLERELTELYGAGEISLRQLGELLGLPTREALELTLRNGVKGSVTMAQSLEASELIDSLAD